MPIFFRGAGVGTYWNQKDATILGFVAQSPGMQASTAVLMDHIARSTTNSPYISLTRSYGVAESYAKLAGRNFPTAESPGYVYRLVIDDPLPSGLVLVDPVTQILGSLPGPLASQYQHDGRPEFLLGVVSPVRMSQYLTALAPQAPGAQGTPRSPNLSIELEMLVRALRDAEILALGIVPRNCVVARMAVS